MHDTPTTSTPTTPEYETPKVETLGTLLELTQGGVGITADGGFGFDSSIGPT